ncbi:MAG: hypothetical protein F6K47_37425 [Symploca sp. SIO2E6]|nr:hypothetical protein [Symploca sp. SIO2E6]
MNFDNVRAIRKLVEKALGDDELLDLCQDDFPSVHGQFIALRARQQLIWQQATVSHNWVIG